MRSIFSLLACLATGYLLPGCIDPVAPTFDATVDVVVVDGTITNLAEPQVIRLNRSKADPFTGRFGSTPLSKANVQVVVNGTEVIPFKETTLGKYEGPAGFYGRVGNRYQLRFQLGGGPTYESSVESMPAIPDIELVRDKYNPIGGVGQKDGLQASNDIYITTTDPAGQVNQYRWDWVLWERQTWCRSCTNGMYYEYDETGKLIEDCVPNNSNSRVSVTYDYECRSSCWEILFSNQLNLFSDTYTNGRPIIDRLVAQIPFYQYYPALVEVRQSALTATAYTYFKRLEEQTQRTGGLTDTPPAAPVGNIQNISDNRQAVVGYFTASGVATVRYWLSRRNITNAIPFKPGDDLTNIFFFILNQRPPRKEDLLGVRGRPPLAVCVASDTRTPIKPKGWQE